MVASICRKVLFPVVVCTLTVMKHRQCYEAQTDSAMLLLLLIFMKCCEMWKPLVTLRNNLTELNFVNPFCQCVCEWLCYRLFE